jgi:hypothetical protein
MQQVELTMYGYPDNSPPGNGIQFPGLHKAAGGTGTYDDPLTFATDPTEEKPGTRIYIPAYLKYAIMEDGCVACESDWKSMKWHFDIWLPSNAGTDSAKVQNCEGQWSFSKSTVEINPPTGRVVDSKQLYDVSANTCSSTP